MVRINNIILEYYILFIDIPIYDLRKSSKKSYNTLVFINEDIQIGKLTK